MIDIIINGDCLEVMPTIPDNSVDMVLADLPYGVEAAGSWDKLVPLDKLWCQLERIVKQDTAMVFTAVHPFVMQLINSNPALFKYEWIWDKKNAANFYQSRYQPLRTHENILVFSKAAATYTKQSTKLRYNPQMGSGEPYARTRLNSGNYSYRNSWQQHKTENAGTRYPTSILHIVRPQMGGSLHPTQKPVALFEYLIRTYTNEGDTVLDPTAGSGTTAVACRKSNRHYICIEKEADYCAIAEKRIKEML